MIIIVVLHVVTALMHEGVALLRVGRRSPASPLLSAPLCPLGAIRLAVAAQAEGETSINGGRLKSEISPWKDGAEASWIPGMVDEGTSVSVVMVSSLLVRNTGHFPVPAPHVRLRATDEQQWEVQFHRMQKAKRKIACLHYLYTRRQFRVSRASFRAGDCCSTRIAPSGESRGMGGWILADSNSGRP